MIVDADISIAAPAATVWALLTDIEHAADVIKGIVAIELLARPASGLVGLRWRETRILFGKPATVEKWVSAAEHLQFVETRAESDGFVFVTTKRLSADAGGGANFGATIVTDSHASLPQNLRASIMTIPMRLFFKGVIRKALLQDLQDVKVAAEQAVAGV